MASHGDQPSPSTTFVQRSTRVVEAPPVVQSMDAMELTRAVQQLQAQRMDDKELVDCLIYCSQAHAERIDKVRGNLRQTRTDLKMVADDLRARTAGLYQRDGGLQQQLKIAEDAITAHRKDVEELLHGAQEITKRIEVDKEGMNIAMGLLENSLNQVEKSVEEMHGGAPDDIQELRHISKALVKETELAIREFERRMSSEVVDGGDLTRAEFVEIR